MAKKKVESTGIKQESGSGKNTIQLPVNFKMLGEVEYDDLKVYIRQDVYTAIERLAKSDTSKELGSILFGDYHEDLGKTHVVISGCIEAKYTDASASTLTFTHETWDFIHKEQERLYPDMKIVGWQHTHPNYGVFLSNYDMFIQENFFNLPFQVAYVVDPLQDIRGFFQWKYGKVEKLKGYYVFDDIGKPVKIEEAGKKNPAGDDKSILKKPWARGIAAISLIVLLSGCVIYLWIGNTHLVSTLEDARTQQAALESKQAEIEQVIAYYESLPGDETISDLQGQIEEQQVIILEQTGTIEELQARLEELKPDDGGSIYYFMSYTVKKGDTLSEICKKYNIDFTASRKILLGVNGIKDADIIHVGQTILIPVSLIYQSS